MTSVDEIRGLFSAVDKWALAERCESGALIDDVRALLAALDKAEQQSWDSEEYANRKHRALRIQATRIWAYKKAIADMRETLETISQIGSHKMDREMAQHCLDRVKGGK